MSINFTTAWPDSALDWIATCGLGLVLGLIVTAVAWWLVER